MVCLVHRARMVRLVLLLSVLQWSCCWSFLQPLRAENAQAAWQPHSGQRVSASGLRRRHLTTASADRGAATSDLAAPLGLLDGVGDPEKAAFYSTSMDLGRAAQMASERGIIFKAAKSDAKKMGIKVQDYLKDIEGKAKSFISSNEIVNREELQQALDGVVNDEGNFVCLLGGKSTGKSLVLENLAARHPGKVFRVNLRREGTILGGLVRVLPQRISREQWARIIADLLGLSKNLTKPLPGIFKFIRGIFLPKAGNSEVVEEALAIMQNAEPGLAAIETASRVLMNLFKDIQSKEDGKGRPLSILVDTMVKELGPVTIVVDEANLAFNVRPTTKDTDIEETIAALEFFTLFSKEALTGNVILVSSEHAFPVGLTREPIGFNLDNFTGFLFAGEAPPKDMLRVLQERWGVGPHLAHALVAHYGGHVWETYLALCTLAGGGSTAFEVGLDPGKSSRVQPCLAWRPEGPGDVKEQQGRMRELLKLLAMRGFAAIPTRDDELAEVISRNNVGGVVQRSALVVGLPEEAWGSGDEYGLVPATQTMRLAIAEELLFEAEKRGK